MIPFFLLIIIIPVVLLLCIVGWFYLKMRGIWRGLTGKEDFRARKYDDRERDFSREKIFDSTVGEYIEFEEIEGAEDLHIDAENKRPSVNIDPQIVDAEWEDIRE